MTTRSSVLLGATGDAAGLLQLGLELPYLGGQGSAFGAFGFGALLGANG
ncbi:hypothetical protein GCM10023085_16410 [Actinomadura viridis]|uniref:Uncharacterized protein n=1 Tax=Actinomadura viridis TaxID=58110 RepID=A0A931GJD5_9ACTN|nr:hypothetical protein [Actinomadura viridis]MBG6089598.1 hypothetical protein [Actinomadura viridis]